MPESEPVSAHALALICAIEVLRGTLGDATDYLDHDRHLAALGTLASFEEQAEDLKAAIRLFRRSVQTDKRRAK
jgi:hypothetical protein